MSAPRGPSTVYVDRLLREVCVSHDARRAARTLARLGIVQLFARGRWESIGGAPARAMRVIVNALFGASPARIEPAPRPMPDPDGRSAEPEKAVRS